jgi:uncharacterized protein
MGSQTIGQCVHDRRAWPNWKKALSADPQGAAWFGSPCPGVALSPEQLHEVRQIMAQVISGAQVCIFGSRATGKARPFSDLDLLLTQPSKLNWAQRVALRDGFEASRLPFFVDVVESAGLAFGMAERIRSEQIDLQAL